ncbi:MAG: 3,4-dihydroxy-9,10-secoandrosta,3,5(10)-triene-9,17-dione 4,5-dioxygenase [Cryptosporangiaceae bacterium]|nr:3,4-dihydroxy-9,10-secoandrosta,3,5(10)-triene-9,17-dione 4,5-dioxygenase [Cryptosporangiaceae bacterium]
MSERSEGRGMGVRSLGYLRIEATDLDAWRVFGLKVLGMTEGRGPDPDALYLRMDGLPARLVIVPGERDKLLAAGFELADPQSLARVARTLDEAGVAIKQGDAAELADRRVMDMIRVDDPSGNPVELFWGAALDNRPAISPYGNRFVTGEMGLGHVVLPATDDAAGLHFYTELLGFQLRDSMRFAPETLGLPPGDPVWMRFLGCSPRHHSVAFAPIPAKSGIVHVMIEVDSLDAVGLAVDRCQKNRAPLVTTLGRHANDYMVSFYLRTPSGFDIEYGTDGLLVDEAAWVSRETTAHSMWGHRYLRGAAT